MRPRPFAVERFRGRSEAMMQRTIDAHRAATANSSERNRREAMAEACREDLVERLRGMGLSDAGLYVAELRRWLNEGVDIASLCRGAR